jgi:3-oxoadipate enol-lactonase
MARVTTASGITIGYEEAGGGERTPIIFLHGVGSDKSVWRRQLARFAPDRRAIAFDYPGYGDSDPVIEGMTRDDFATSILAAMSELQVDRAHVCGLSLGGVIAIAMHHAWPKRVRSLILADSFADHPDGQAIYDRSVAGSENMRALAESRADVLLAQPADPLVRSEVIETMAGIDAAAYVIGAEAVWLAKQRERAHAIRVPTLVLCGTEDKPTPPALSQALARLIPGAQYESIERAGHLGNIEQPDTFNTLVNAFIRGVDSRN